MARSDTTIQKLRADLFLGKGEPFVAIQIYAIVT